MSRSISGSIPARSASLSRFAIGFAVAIGAVAQGAAAQSASTKTAAAPSGWVGLSVIQNSRSGADSAVKLEYPVIASVDPKSPASSAGLVAGDTILSYNDVDATSSAEAVNRFLTPGSKLAVKIRRNGVRTLSLTVAKRPANSAYRASVTMKTSAATLLPLAAGSLTGPVAIAARVPSERAAPFAGAYMARLNAGLANVLNVHPAGVLIIDVGAGSEAQKAGLRAGDVITRADSIAVASPLAIMTAMNLAAARSITVDVTRDGKTHKLTITW